MILIATAAAAGRVSDTGGLTATALIVTAIFALVVIAGILLGVRQKRARTAGERDERRRADTLDAPPRTVDAPLPPAPPPLGTPAAAKPRPAAKPKSTARPAPKAVAAKPDTATPAPPVAKPAPPAAKAVAARPVAAKPVAAKPAAAKPVAAKPVAATTYRLIDVKGLGPKAVPLLEAQGVADLAALAGLTDARAAEIDGSLGVLSGRMARDRWVAQAKLLAAGDIAAFEATYGKL